MKIRVKRRRTKSLDEDQARRDRLDKDLDTIVDRWKEHSLRRPAVLHHYTKWAGFEGILSSQLIRAGNHRSMNDAAEIVSADDIIQEVAVGLRPSHSGEALAALDRFLAAYDDQRISRIATVYLACFSEAGDKPSQWRDYADGGRGVCLTLELLDEEAEKVPGVALGLMRVEYDEDTCRASLRRDFQDVLATYERHMADGLNTKDGFGYVRSALFRVTALTAVRFKRREYASEEEWRLVGLVRTEDLEKVRRKPLADDRECLELRLRGEDKLIALQEVVLGPSSPWWKGWDACDEA